MPVLPPSFLFRYAVPVHPVEAGASLLDAAVEPFPHFGELDAAGAASRRFGRVVFGWSERGFGVGVEVGGKRHPPVYDVVAPWDSDGLLLWLDTRPTGNVHRATRFCHHFCLLPGAALEGDPPIVALSVDRARESAESAADVPVESTSTDDGYRIEAWFEPRHLHGYDPEASPRLGAYFHLRDAELGDRYAVVGPEFPFASDPSLWVTLELVDE